jgi:plastocyanin
MNDEGRGPRLPAIAYPVLSLLFAAILVWSFSRVLLAVDKTQSVIIAILMAVNILVGSALVAYGRRVKGRPLAFPFLVVAAAILVVSGVVSAVAVGDRAPGKEEAGPTQAVALSAADIAFDTKTLTLTAGAKVTLTFDNKDTGVPHNVVITQDQAGAQVLFHGDIITGPATATYSFVAPPPGGYFFHCEVHPTTMTGTVAVSPPGEGPGGGPPPGGGLSLEAKNIAFDPKTLSAPAGGQVTVHFTNADAGTPHNFSIYTDESATQPIFQGQIVNGPGSADYGFAAPPAGSYFFRCDVHPTLMSGTITFTG